MLTSLSIKNFALIEALDVEFFGGLSIITGETGAGKSIVLGALSLLQGKRADLNSLKDKNEKCIVEGVFQIENYGLENTFAQWEIDYEKETIIRREILPSGKSRAFINDMPVTLHVLQNISDRLIDIHSQHQTRDLSEENYQLEIVDALANNQALLKSYKASFFYYKQLMKDLEKWKVKQIETLKEQDYNQFLFEELRDSGLDAIHQGELESEYEKLDNVEFVRESFGQVWTLLGEEELGVLGRLKQAKQALQKIVSISVEYQQLFDRVESVEIELSDIQSELEEQLDSVLSDPKRLSQLYTQLQLLYNLQKKHQVQSVSELLEIQKGLEEKICDASHLDEKIAETEAALDKTLAQLDTLSLEIRENRNKAIPLLQDRLKQIVGVLGMPNAGFQFLLSDSDSYMEDGKDHMQLLFSANKGVDYGLLKKVASGGEQSRIMLAVKAVLAEYSQLPTLILDEIDTGISGEIADKMGGIMKEMSKSMQVFSITHLPQIAAKGERHYKVYKISDEATTASNLVRLDEEERVLELAQMLSGLQVTESALKHARELLATGK